jgi:hypothetical protein
MVEPRQVVLRKIGGAVRGKADASPRFSSEKNSRWPLGRDQEDELDLAHIGGKARKGTYIF